MPVGHSKKPVMHLVFCSDQNYLPWCAVPAKTAIEKTSHRSPIALHFILTHDCRDTSSLRTLIAHLESPSVSIHTYFVHESDYSDLPVSGHGSTANYFRLLIPDLLPHDIKKVIYLDCDLLVLESLLPLWETELYDAPLAAVSDMSLFETEAARLKIPYLHGIFNSGVLVMNLSFFRKHGFHFQCIKKAKQMGDKIVYWDQDVLNILASGSWLKLDNSWNVQHGYYLDHFIRDKYNVSQPKIMHFTSRALKPWRSIRLPLSDTYMREFHSFGFKQDDPQSATMAATEAIRKAALIPKILLRKILFLTLFYPKLVVALAPAYQSVIRTVSEILHTKERDSATQAARARQKRIISRYFPSCVVAAGPFQRMRYATNAEIGSLPLPKLAGSYEIEISHLFNYGFLSKFDEFINVGCGEDYYAVGAAIVAPSLIVRAFDNDPQALSRCRAMAELNAVSDRVKTADCFSLAKLSELRGSENIPKYLLLVDCEGSEASIFSSESRAYRALLKNSTIIVESHEFVRRGMANHITRFFASSHSVERVLAVGDVLRPSYFSEFIPNHCLPNQVVEILAEKRPASMEWLIFRPLCEENGTGRLPDSFTRRKQDIRSLGEP